MANQSTFYKYTLVYRREVPNHHINCGVLLRPLPLAINVKKCGWLCALFCSYVIWFSNRACITKSKTRWNCLFWVKNVGRCFAMLATSLACIITSKCSRFRGTPAYALLRNGQPHFIFSSLDTRRDFKKTHSVCLNGFGWCCHSDKSIYPFFAQRSHAAHAHCFAYVQNHMLAQWYRPISIHVVIRSHNEFV